MPLSTVKGSIWTPEGEYVQKDVIAIDRMELQTLSRMHEIAFKYGLSIVCKRCDSAITGQNNDSTPVPAVACQCREWRYVRG